MLSRRRCFNGKTVSHIIVHVTEQETDWGKLPDTVSGGHPVRVGESSATPYSLVLNWTSLWKR